MPALKLPFLMNCRNMRKGTVCILKVVSISVKQMSPMHKPCTLYNTDSSKWPLTSSSTKASLNDQVVIWKFINLIIMSTRTWIYEMHEYTCAEIQNAWCEKYTYTYHEKGLIHSIPEYRVIETSKMLPLQKLDEEWGSCGIFWDSCACAWVCLGGKATDWLAHSKWKEPYQEELWHTGDIVTIENYHVSKRVKLVQTSNTCILLHCRICLYQVQYWFKKIN